jgi:hypothetical protein
VNSDIVERLRKAHQTVPIPAIASPPCVAADLIDAIDAQVAAYMHDSIGSSAAIRAISRLLHPEGGPS